VREMGTAVLAANLPLCRPLTMKLSALIFRKKPTPPTITPPVEMIDINLRAVSNDISRTDFEVKSSHSGGHESV
jgi:hypothetical protein